jgi:hypothetical protein
LFKFIDKKIIMRLFKVFIFIGLIYSCAAANTSLNKINGVSFVASSNPIDSTNVAPVVSINANYATIMPFGFIKDLQNPKLVYNSDRQWFGETKLGAKQYIETLQARGIQIMVKPQIWVWHGEFTGYISMDNEEDWKQLEKGYTDFILDYAELAQSTNSEILCIGTELEKFVEQRPDFWFELINKIKKVYKGKLTYAANWDEFKRTPFWNELDFIGIDAYFPVSESKTPTVEECKLGWLPHKTVIKNISSKYNKPILFTEYGYRSVDYTGREPWVSDRNMQDVNLEAQVNTTQALFEMFWEEPWFAGGFVWKWFHNHDEVGGEANFMFTPQNKPVEQLLRTHYSEY